MEIEFDPGKDQENRRKHGMSLQAASDFDLDAAWIVPDRRQDYGEARYRCIGFLRERLCTLIMIVRGTRVRAISLRKASHQEQREYAENI